MEKKKKLAAALLLSTVVVASALDSRLAVRRYTIVSPKLEGMVRVALVTDLHSCSYGKDQRQLLTAIRGQAPDLILLGGDIFDDRRPPAPALALLTALVKQFPCYYATGNHEYWTGRVPEIKAYLAGLGVHVVDGVCLPVSVRGQVLNLCGVDDAEGGESAFCAQLEALGRDQVEGAYTLLLAHRPERMGQYLETNCDLVLSGHAHGGQWRIPGLVNGVFAPDEGLFPRHAGGLYEISGRTLVVSRGLARESTRVPRIWNRPELVILDLEPEA